jgi:hypothetical protein
MEIGVHGVLDEIEKRVKEGITESFGCLFGSFGVLVEEG